MEPVRRKLLIEATIAAIHARGSAEVTMREIASHAGVSLGLAHHYFGNRQNLMMAAMRYVMSDYARQVRAALANAEGPRQRLSAIIRASLAREQFNPEIVSAWLVFYAQAQGSAEARHLLSVYTRRLHSNLCYALRPLVGREAPRIAAGIAAMIDGLYVREGLGTHRLAFVARGSRADADADADPGGGIDGAALLADYVDIQIAGSRVRSGPLAPST